MLDQDLEIQLKAARLAAEEDREQSLQLRRHLGRSQKSITSLQQMVCDATQQLQGESTLLQIARFALKRTQTEALRLHRVADTAKELEEAVRNRQVAAGLQLQHAQARTHQAQIQKAAETVKNLEQEVLSESAEAEAVLLELERVAGAYRQAHQEHQDLLQAVEVARAGLKEADASLEARHAEVARSRKDEQGGRAAAAAAQARLDGLRQEAAAREHQIAAAEAQRAQRAQELHAAQQAEQDAQQRVEDLRLQLSRARQEVAGREETLASARASLEALQHVAQASQATERTDAACLVGKGGEEEQGTGALLDLETARDAAAFELAGLERERTKARDRAAAAVAALKEAERNLGVLATQVQQAAGALAATQGQNSALEKEVFMEQDVLYGCEMQRHRLEQEVGQLTRGIKTEEEDLVKAVAAARQMAEQIVEDKAALLKLLDEVKELRRENAAAEQAAEAAEAACMEAEVEVEAARAELERLHAAQVTARSSLVDQLAKAARAHGALARTHAPTAARCAQLPAAAWCRAAGADLRLPARVESLRPLAQWLDVAGVPVQLAMLSMLQRAAVDALLAADEACPGAGVAQALREAAPWAIRGSAAQRSGRLRRRSSVSQGMDSARSCCSASGQILLRVQSVALGARAHDAGAGHLPKISPRVTSSANGKLTVVSTGARWENEVGYSRAVKRGNFIAVSGTSSVEQSTGNVLHKRDPYAQARTALEIVAHGLEALGATLEDVIRTRVYLRNMGRDSAAVSRAHGEVFGAIRPASSMIEVQRLVHDDILVLIEVDAIVS
ncbi:Uncharacterized protein F751_5167 [Auxenochlorella protothecoides]|uniref:Uncharacterized protein n=1 Tax=Auxenochlorella protothecoides TaxID=3075 RepID=A0A087SQQ2_AUXPR|nr:Uncharacterized protein F751_5167 [Auxenochlorella protothecoides]KFM28056.1 Uncharacterized protein F751_5167 [Auxenochlorella protothecoides]